MCSDHLVTAAVKDKIAAYAASFRKATRSPFGAEDEIGMLNLMDAGSRKAIMDRADPSKVYDLSVDNFIGMPGWFEAGDQPYQIWMTHSPKGEEVDNARGFSKAANELVAYSGDAISMYTHTGTHIDALNHFGYHGVIFNHFTVKDHLGSRAWRKAGAEKHPPIVARGILLDVPGMLGLDVLPPSYAIGEADLRNCLKHQGTALRPGDVVLFRTGRMRLWPDHAAYLPKPPGINREGAEFLAKAGAIMVGADNHSLEPHPFPDAESWQIVHTYLLTEAGVPILEIANLEELAEDRVYEFAFMGACIRLRGATGAPMRPIAMPLRK